MFLARSSVMELQSPAGMWTHPLEPQTHVDKSTGQVKTERLLQGVSLCV